MQHVLRAIAGPHAGAVYVLGSRTTIGRASDCDVQILHEGVSRHHAKVTVEDDVVVVTDLSSDNGTFVDEVRVERHVLRTGEVLRIMRSRFAYEELHAHDAQTSAVFRRKVTSGDSLRQTLVLGKASATHRARLAHGVPAGTLAERGRPYSRPQAAAPALSGARPGAAATLGAETLAGPRAVVKPSLVSGEAGAPARERDAVAVEARGSSEAAPARLPTTHASVPSRHGTLGRGRRERVAVPPSSLGPLPSSASSRLERVVPSPSPSGPSGRMAPLAPAGPEHEPHVPPTTESPVASPPTSALGGGWVRVSRPLDTPGSMRPGSTLSGMQRVDLRASPPAPRSEPAPSVSPRPAGKPITAEYGAMIDDEPVARRASGTPTEEVPRVPERAPQDVGRASVSEVAPTVEIAAIAGPSSAASGAPREPANGAQREGDGLERLVDVLEYRELRLQSLHGAPDDARRAQRCTALEAVLQQRASVGDERATLRRYHRFECSIAGQLTHRRQGTTAVAPMEITDLSAGGAKITLAELAIGVGETVWLAIDLGAADRSRLPRPDATTVVLKARVVWGLPHKASLGLVFAGAPRYEQDGAQVP
jgi:hypothetical protein